MVKAYYNQWKINQAIKSLQENMGAAAQELCETLFKKSTSAEELHAADTLRVVENKMKHKLLLPTTPMLEQDNMAPTVYIHVSPVTAPTQ